LAFPIRWDSLGSHSSARNTTRSPWENPSSSKSRNVFVPVSGGITTSISVVAAVDDSAVGVLATPPSATNSASTAAAVDVRFLMCSLPPSDPERVGRSLESVGPSADRTLLSRVELEGLHDGRRSLHQALEVRPRTDDRDGHDVCRHPLGEVEQVETH